MNPPRFRLAFRSILTGLLLLAATGPAWANYYELLRRVPESANTLIMIDVERMLMSPIAMKEKWLDKANSAEGRCSTSRPTRSATCSRRSSTSSRISPTCGTLP